MTPRLALSIPQGQSEERAAGVERGEQQPGPVDHQLHVEPERHSDHGDGRAQGGGAVRRRGGRVAQLPVRGSAAVAVAGGLGCGGRVGRRPRCVDRPVRDGGCGKLDQLDVGRDVRRRLAEGRPSPGRVQAPPAAGGRAAQDGQLFRGCH